MANPNYGRENRYARIDYVGDNSIRETYDHGAFRITELVINAVMVGSSEAVQRFEAFAKGLQNLQQTAKNDLASTHFQVAEAMQVATVAAYETAHAKGRKNAPYRLSSRDAGGRMLAALNSPLFVRGTYDGIGFANVTLLNQQARQWHRLNFGAQGREGGGAKTGAYTATWEGLVIGAFGFTDESPSAGFTLPKGIWLSEGDGSVVAAGKGTRDHFYPRNGVTGPLRAQRPTKGIKAWNFLDAGVKVLAEEIGPAYGNLYSKWFNMAAKGLGPLNAQISVPPPRRTPLRLP